MLIDKSAFDIPTQVMLSIVYVDLSKQISEEWPKADIDLLRDRIASQLLRLASFGERDPVVLKRAVLTSLHIVRLTEH